MGTATEITQVWIDDEIAFDLNASTVISSYVYGNKLITSAYGWYLYNAHGDVTALTNSTGMITRNYDYDPLGVQRSSVDAADNNPYRYCGEYYDIESGYTYLRARYYDPSIGRFVSEDPAGQGENYYIYCGNDSIIFIDKSGEYATPIIATAVVLYYLSKVAIAPSSKGVKRLESLEDFRSRAYKALPQETKRTIGYGHVIQNGLKKVKVGKKKYKKITKKQASEILEKDLKERFVPKFNSFLSKNKIALTQTKYDACIIDCYQKGENIWDNQVRDIAKFIKAGKRFGDYNAVLKAFIDGTPNEGLINRRTREANLFVYGTY